MKECTRNCEVGYFVVNRGAPIFKQLVFARLVNFMIRRLFFPLLFLATVTGGVCDVGTFQIPRAGESEAVPFFYRKPHVPPTGILLLVPGYNGSGEAMMDERWGRFADENGLVLLAPTFHATPEQLKKERGYYYPEQGSGAQVEQALAEVRRKTGVKTDKILIFGFSAGAHFAHRFALWKPERVRAFVAYSAAWWSDPKPSLRSVPALIMCGESDDRFEATRAFMEKALSLHLPWVWRSYKNTAHELTPAVRSMAEVFLAHYSQGRPTGAPSAPVLYGDIQTYRAIPATDKETIPEEVRVELPSQAVADIWVKEN